MSRIDDFSKAGQALAETKRTSVAQAQSRYDFDIAAEYGYQYAVDRACEWMREHLGAPEGIPQAKAYEDAMNELITEFRKAMEE